MCGESLQPELQHHQEMKKFIIAACLIGLLSLASCKSENSKPENNSLTMEKTKQTINATRQELAGVKKALDAYIEAAVKGDSNIAKPVFGDLATISYSENDSLVSSPIQALYDYYDQTGPHHAEYEITSLEVAGNVAVVRIDSKFGDVAFDDMFALVKDGENWKIVSKVYNVK